MSVDFALENNETGAAAEAPAEGTFVHNAQHVAEGIGHLIDLFRYGPRHQAAVSAVLEEVQELEDAIVDVLGAFDPDTAVGQALDFLGRLVGEPRLGRSDDEYRAGIRVRTLVNFSDGKLEQLYEILVGIFLAADVTFLIDEYYPARLVVEVSGDPGAVTIETVHRLMTQARAGGVALATVLSVDAGDETGLIWTDEDGADLDAGWADSADAAGGSWAQSL